MLRLCSFHSIKAMLSKLNALHVRVVINSGIQRGYLILTALLLLFYLGVLFDEWKRGMDFL